MSEQDFLTEAAELIKAIEEAETQDFMDLAQLADIDTHEDLAGQNLSRMSFQGANLSGSDLSSTDLSHSDLRDADLRKSNLLEADLRYAIVANAIFEDCQGLGESARENLKKRGALFSSELYYAAQRVHAILLEQTNQKFQGSQSSVFSTISAVSSIAGAAGVAAGAASAASLVIGLGPLVVVGGSVAALAYAKARRRTVKFSESVDKFLQVKTSRLESLKGFISQELQSSNLQKELSEIDILVLAYARGIEQLSSSLTPPDLKPEQWLKKISTDAIEEIQRQQDYADISI